MTNITCDQLVQREVIYCVSGLISELAKDEKYMDELSPVLVQDDYESAASDEGWGSGNIDKFGVHYFRNTDGATWAAPDTRDGWCELCDEMGIEPYQSEAYEHWVVSNWLADKLEAEGEMIIRDFMGIGAIWGRSTTGQAIAMDYVIGKIHAQLIGKAA
jgi:hypothetical protein